MEIATPAKSYRPVGRCIYCNQWHSRLEKEHILPFSIAANSLVLFKSSCHRCRKKTHEFETVTLKYIWRPFRTRIGAPSRNKEEIKGYSLRRIFVQRFKDDGSIDYEKAGEKFLDPLQYPMYYLAYKFREPAILSPRPADQDVCIPFLLAAEEEIRKYAPNDKDGFRIGAQRPEAFCAMLAKIAHAYAVAELGMHSFRPSLTVFLRGGNARIPEWVGGSIDVPPPSRSLHEIGLRAERIGNRTYIVVSLRLFCFLGTPQYTIVVGELDGGFKEVGLLENPLYKIETKEPVSTPKLSLIIYGKSGD